MSNTALSNTFVQLKKISFGRWRPLEIIQCFSDIFLLSSLLCISFKLQVFSFCQTAYQGSFVLTNLFRIDEECLEDGFILKPKSLHSWLTRVLYNRRSKLDPLWNDYIVAGIQDGEPYVFPFFEFWFVIRLLVVKWTIKYISMLEQTTS